MFTTSQEAKIKECVAKWCNIIVSTEPANRAEAEEAVRKLYELNGQPLPEKIIWCDSPKAASEVIGYLPRNAVVEIGMMALYDYYQTEHLLTDKQPDITTDTVNVHMRLAEVTGPVYPFEKGCVCCDRPIVYKMNEEGKLHCTTGPALEYRDGFKLYSVNGETMSEKDFKKQFDIP